MFTVTPHPPQVRFPGQSHVAEGPHDQTGMYMMHHGFRRDLERFVAAVAATPLDEPQVWAALARRWNRFDEVLHHHHQVEDTAFWPVMLRHADEAGDRGDRETLEAMEAEHGIIDPALTASRHGFENMVHCPCDSHRARLLSEIADLQEHLLRHLAHEEGEALPILQRTVTAAEYAAMEKAAAAGYPPKLLAFLVPWVLDGLPQEGRDAIVRMTGRAYLVLHAVVRRRYERADRLAFRYA